MRGIGMKLGLWAAAAGLWLGLGAATAEAACLPMAGLRPTIMPASLRLAALKSGEVGISYLGHSSFLVETAGGVGAVTDYNGFNRPARLPDIVTMNVAHTTHYTDAPEPGIRHVLRGWDPGGGRAEHNITYKDLRVRNIPTNIREWSGGTRRWGNSIFIFETGDLCIAHLGHLHHELTPQHLAELGQIDVLMVPVDGGFTLGQVDMLEVMATIKAPLVLPMHYFSRSNLERFVARAGEQYRVVWSESPATVVARKSLPAQPTILVLPGS